MRFTLMHAFLDVTQARLGISLSASEIALSTCVLMAVIGCGSTEPQPGFRTGQVSVSVSTVGFDVDPFGYTLTVDDRQIFQLPANGIRVISGVDVGEHSLRISGIEPNCHLEGSSDRTVTVVQSAPAREAVAVRCEALGRVTVAVTTQGGDLDFDGYQVLLSAASHAPLPVTANDTVAFDPFLIPDSLSVELADIASNCTLSGSNLRILSLPEDGRVTVSYMVDCVAAPGTITMAVTTAGYNLDPDGYGMTLDDAPPVAAAPSGDIVFTDVGVGAHLVSLTGVSGNCYAVGGPVWSLIVDPLEAVRVPVEVRCTPPLAIATPAFRIQVGEGAQYNTIASGFSVAWSPTGTMLVVSSGNLWLMNPDGSGSTLLTQGLTSANVPDWSPDGTMIAFEVRPPNLSWRVAVISVDGTGFNVLQSNLVGFERAPSWSPTSSEIVFNRELFGGRPRLHLMNADGTGRRALLSSGLIDRYPTWSPDGQFIAFVRITNTGSQLMQLRVSDDQVSTLATTTSRLKDPSWAPDNSHLLAVTENHELVLVSAAGGQLVVLLDSVRSASWRP